MKKMFIRLLSVSNVSIGFVLIQLVCYSSVYDEPKEPNITIVAPAFHAPYGYESFVFTPDSKRIMTLAHNAVLWDIETGKQLSILSPNVDKDMINAAFSSDGRLVITGEIDYSSRLWDVKSGNLLYTFINPMAPQKGTPEYNRAFPGYMMGVDFSLDNTKVITLDTANWLMIWDVNTGQELMRKGQTGLWDYVFSLPDEKRVFSDGYEGHFDCAVYNYETGKVVQQYNGVGATLSYDRTKLFIDRGTDGISIYNTDTGDLIKNYPKSYYGYTLCTFSSDGRLQVHQDGDLLLLKDINVMQVLRTFKNHSFHKILFSPDGKKFAGMSGYTIYVWDISDLTSGIPGAQEQK